MLLWLALVIFGVVGPVVATHFLTRLFRFKAASAVVSLSALPSPVRYRPMLRLLSAEDSSLVGSNGQLVRTLRRQRVQIFREYLRCLSRDYARLLAGVRLAMVKSGSDRPDLARALFRNQALFALAVCRIEYLLVLYSLGLPSFDAGRVSVVAGRLVEAFDSMRQQIAVPMLSAGSLSAA